MRVFSPLVIRGFGVVGFLQRGTGAALICHLMTLCLGANGEVAVGQLVVVRSLFATCSRDDYSFFTEVDSCPFKEGA